MLRLLSAAQVRSGLTWSTAIDSLRRGHLGQPPIVQDILLSDNAFSLFGRGVILPGFGAGMKVAAIHPPNLDRPEPSPAEDALFAVIGEDSKRIEMIVDGAELTRWKTAADSALASSLLSREDSETLLVIGAGPIAAALAEAHLFVRPNLSRVLLWNRSPEKLAPLQARLEELGRSVEVIDDLARATAQSDIITSATSSREPLVQGAWVSPGCHVDLVGGFTPDMREADDDLVTRARLYVDYRETTIGHAGDICDPIARGIISPRDIEADLFELVKSQKGRVSDEITLYKNAGGAHIDLLVASVLR